MSAQPQIVIVDERTKSVANEGHRWAYGVLTYALLLDVVYRGVVRNEAAWDLLVMIIAGGAVCAIYQARQKAMPAGWAMHAAILACLSAAVAAVVSFFVA